MNRPGEAPINRLGQSALEGADNLDASWWWSITNHLLTDDSLTAPSTLVVATVSSELGFCQSLRGHSRGSLTTTR
jgi:hypothetical protein